MNLQTAIQIGTLLSVIVGFTSLIVAINNYRRQMNAQVIMRYAERFERIMDYFPDNFFVTYYLDEELPPQNSKLTLSVLKYLNLCAEEFYLQKNGYMSKDIWSVWEGDLKRMLTSSLIIREWLTLRKQFEEFPDFFEYVENLQKSGQKKE